MQSPYFLSDSPVRFGPPPGLADIMAQRSKQMQQSMDSIGNFAGALGGGVAGAAQGAADPGVMGASSSGGGAAQGFLKNFANIGGYGGGGQGGGGGSAFASMVNGGGGTGAMTVKQLQAAAKTADAFRDQMSLHSPQVEGQDAKVLGATDDEWKTLGASDKWAKVQGFVQGQVQSEVGAKLQDFAAQARERDAQAQSIADTGRFLGHVFNTPAVTSSDEAATGGEATRDPSMMERFAYAGKQMGQNWNAGRAMPGILNALDKYAAMGQASKWNLAPGQPMTGPDGLTGVPQSPNSMQWFQDPSRIAEAAAAKQGAKPKYTIRSVPNPLTGEVTPTVEANTLEDWKQGQEDLQKWQKAQAGETGKALTAAQAKDFLSQAKGDKVKARQLAKDAGYTF